MTSEARRFPAGLTVAAAIGVAILIGLGVWQLQRLHWKQGVLSRVAALQTAPAQPIGPVLAKAGRGQDVEFTRVSVDCLPFQFPKTRIFLFGVRETAVQWRPITPCAIDEAAYGMVALDRGVIAGSDRTTPPGGSVADARQVIGVLRAVGQPNFIQKNVTLAENDDIGYQTRDHALAALEKATGLPAPRWMVVVEKEVPAPAGVTPQPLPADIPNNHFQYALTWFGLAAALAGVYAAVLFRKARVR